eukprot:PhM_4_TR9093/c0_g1_i1/m.36792
MTTDDLIQTINTDNMSGFSDALRNCPDVNQTDSYGNTPLYYACVRGNDVMVRQLLKRFAVDHEDRRCWRYAASVHIRKMLDRAFGRRTRVANGRDSRTGRPRRVIREERMEEENNNNNNNEEEGVSAVVMSRRLRGEPDSGGRPRRAHLRRREQQQQSELCAIQLRNEVTELRCLLESSRRENAVLRRQLEGAGGASHSNNSNQQNIVSRIAEMGFEHDLVQRLFNANPAWDADQLLEAVISGVRVPNNNDNKNNGNSYSSSSSSGDSDDDGERSITNDDECKICMDRMSNVLFLPCGHLGFCTDCAAKLQECPVCRTLISSQHVVYRV